MNLRGLWKGKGAGFRGTLLFICGILLGGCRVGYVVKAGYYQLELLSLREPLLEARINGGLSRQGLEAIRTVERTRDLAARMGFSTAAIYTSVVVDWERELWNVSACDPLSFEPKVWWFPVVGVVPYLGFFSIEEASREEESLRNEGWDVHRSRVGAYSTLGWFDDPILPGMLRWPEVALRNLVFHELAHATIWFPGSVQFNESFANFVAEKATLQTLAGKAGESTEAYHHALEAFSDERQWRQVLWKLFKDLEVVYQDGDRSESDKMRAKESLFLGLETRLNSASFSRPQRYRKRARSSQWNNARLLQFRRYNSSYAWFEAVYQRAPGDFPQFFHEIKTIVDDSKRPFEALKMAASEGP